MPLLPVVRSCRRHGDRQSPSTRDDPELFKADAVLNLTRPLCKLLQIQACIRQTRGAWIKKKRKKKKKKKKEKRKKHASTEISLLLQASTGAAGVSPHKSAGLTSPTHSEQKQKLLTSVQEKKEVQVRLDVGKKILQIKIKKKEISS